MCADVKLSSVNTFPCMSERVKNVRSGSVRWSIFIKGGCCWCCHLITSSPLTAVCLLAPTVMPHSDARLSLLWTVACNTAAYLQPAKCNDTSFYCSFTSFCQVAKKLLFPTWEWGPQRSPLINLRGHESIKGIRQKYILLQHNTMWAAVVYICQFSLLFLFWNFGHLFIPLKMKLLTAYSMPTLWP